MRWTFVVVLTILAAALLEAWRGGGGMGYLVFLAGLLAMPLGGALAFFGGLLNLIATKSPDFKGGAVLFSKLASAVLIFGMLALISTPFFWMAWQAAVSRVPGRAELLVQAIEKFVISNGAPPENLASLVPDWIEEIPETGLSEYPAFKYRSSVERDEIGTTWSLFVPCSTGIMNWDVMVFYPDGNYEGVGRRNGGTWAPEGSWAYVFE